VPETYTSSVPAYTMAPHAESLKLLRVVVREDFSLQRARTFLQGKCFYEEVESTNLKVADHRTVYPTDLLATIKILDKAPASVHEYHKQAQQERIQEKAEASTNVDDSHSLQGKHGKTHGIC
jgi:glutamate decarboxylase